LGQKGVLNFARPANFLLAQATTVETWGPDTTPIGTGRDERDPPIGDFFPKKNGSDLTGSACNSLAALGRRRAFPLGAVV
jgi:hypothetical protein